MVPLKSARPIGWCRLVVVPGAFRRCRSRDEVPCKFGMASQYRGAGRGLTPFFFCRASISSLSCPYSTPHLVCRDEANRDGFFSHENSTDVVPRSQVEKVLHSKRQQSTRFIFSQESGWNHQRLPLASAVSLSLVLGSRSCSAWHMDMIVSGCDSLEGRGTTASTRFRRGLETRRRSKLIPATRLKKRALPILAPCAGGCGPPRWTSQSSFFHCFVMVAPTSLSCFSIFRTGN